MNIIIGILILPITNDLYAHIAFFTVFALPSIYQIFFSVVWLVKERLFNDLWYLCKPRKLKIDYVYDYENAKWEVRSSTAPVAGY